MDALKVLQARPDLFFRLSGIGLADFTTLVAALEPVWRKQEHKRLSRADRQRAIGGGMKYRLPKRRAKLSPSEQDDLAGFGHIAQFISQVQQASFVFDDLFVSKRWSRDFGSVVKVDRMTRELTQNEETKEPFC